MNVGEAFVVVRPDTKGFSAEADRNITGALEPVFSKIAGMAKAAAITIGVTVTGAMVGLGASVIKTGAAYNTLEQTSRAAFTTILGSAEAANQMMDQLAAFAKKSPFPRQAFITATQELLAFGFAADQVLPTLQAIQDAVAATGGSAQDILDLADVLAKVRSSGQLGVDTLNELAYRGVNGAKLIGEQWGMTEQQFRDTVFGNPLKGKQAFDALDALIAGMEKNFAGAAAGVKNTWVGAFDRIKSAWRDLSSSFMDPFITKTGGGAAIAWANQFADALRVIDVSPIFAAIGAAMPAMNDAVQALIAALGPLVQALGPALASVIPLVLQLATTIGGVLTQAFAGLVPSVVPVLETIARVLGMVLTEALNELAPILANLAPIITDVVVALAPLVLALVRGLAPIIQPIGWAITQVALALAQALTPVVQALAPILASLALKFAAFLGHLAQTGILERVGQLFAKLLDVLAPVAKVLAEALVTALRALEPILPVIASLFERLVPIIAKIAKALEPVIRQLGKELVKAFIELVPSLIPLTDALVQFMEACLPLIPIWTEILTLLVKLLPILVPIAAFLTGVLVVAIDILTVAVTEWQRSWSFAWNAAGAAANWVYDNVIHPVFQGIQWVIDNVVGPAIDRLRGAWDGIADGLQWAWSNIISPILNFIADRIDDVRRALKKLEDIGDKVLHGTGENNGFGGLFGGGGNIGDLLGFGATGAVVTRPTLAVLGEAGPEEVRPLNQMPGASPISAGGYADQSGPLIGELHVHTTGDGMSAGFTAARELRAAQFLAGMN